eukprot:Lithocolla_globosa_v1_NODE_3217_length_1729_cov_10.546595.p2 type:complete len:101 gc:universal NODE_3217_length_1729_cov_10.546595:1149-847(-)
MFIIFFALRPIFLQKDSTVPKGKRTKTKVSTYHLHNEAYWRHHPQPFVLCHPTSPVQFLIFDKSIPVGDDNHVNDCLKKLEESLEELNLCPICNAVVTRQ